MTINLDDLENALHGVRNPRIDQQAAQAYLTLCRAVQEGEAALVPVEPTEAQLFIGSKAKDSTFAMAAGLPTDHFPHKATYRAMLNTAPKSPYLPEGI